MDLGHYLSQERRIKLLERRLRNAIERASKYKRRYLVLGGKIRSTTRTEKAMVLIVQIKTGELTMTYKEVAKRCFLSHCYILELSSRYNKEQQCEN